MKTKKNTLLKRSLCLLISLSCILSVLMPYGAPVASAEQTLDEMRDEYNKIEQQIQQNEQKLQDAQQGIASNEKKLENLNDQIDAINKQTDILQDRIDVLNGEIGTLQSSIDLTQNDIDAINEQIAEINFQMSQAEILMQETKEMLLARIRENYMSGESSTLEILFSSNDLATFFARQELVTRVSENDAALISDLSHKITELEDLQKQLSESKAELEEKKTQLDTEMDTLNTRQTDLESSMDEQKSKKSTATAKYKEVQSIINTLDKNSAAYKAANAKLEAERAALEKEIDDYIKEHGSSQGDTPPEEYENDGSGMMWPVKGKTTVTAGYPAYSNGNPHWGIDICVVGSNGSTRDNNGNSYSYGQPYYAAQGGKVIIAYNDGNWNSGFGNYCVIDHGDGTMTLYAHSKSLSVSKGDIVKRGQQIGLIGDTGNVTGPHLHFEVRVKNSDGSVSRVNPLNYVSKP